MVEAFRLGLRLARACPMMRAMRHAYSGCRADGRSKTHEQTDTQTKQTVNNMRRVAPFCACCDRSPTSLASFSATAILAQAIGNKPLAASLCIPEAHVLLRPTAARLAPVDHRTTTRASWRAERTSTCIVALSSTGTPRTHSQIKTTFCSFVLTRCEVSVGRGVEVAQVGGRTAYFKHCSQHPAHRLRFAKKNNMTIE